MEAKKAEAKKEDVKKEEVKKVEPEKPKPVTEAPKDPHWKAPVYQKTQEMVANKPRPMSALEMMDLQFDGQKMESEMDNFDTELQKNKASLGKAV